ncbi:MAG: glycosyltransferase family 2 protein [Candidatus Scalindua sp.]|jgi:glycosyltransferase involved in cell wall biosynthesis|nr:glycosyltransferase family 2 protein [Candidatus Scalindua sp.]
MISVIITTQNRIDDLSRLLPELKKVNIPQFEIIIVDNDSTDGSAEFVSEQHPDVKLIKLHWNAAGITGRNIAAKNARHQILVSLDDDAIITEQTFKTILNRFQEDITLGVIPCSVINGEKVSNRSKYEEGLPIDNSGTEMFSATACGLAFRKEIFNKFGYWEDWGQEAPFELSLIIKCLSSGLKIKRFKDISVFHYHSPSVTRSSKKAHYSATKSWIWWYFKFYPINKIIRNVLRIIHTACYAIIEQKTFLYINAVFSSIRDIPSIYFIERQPIPLKYLEKIRTTDNFKGG